MEPDGVDHEDGIVEDVLKAGEGNQHFPEFIIDSGTIM